MQRSFQTMPHIALSVETDVTELEQTRARLNALAEARGEAKISLTALVVKVTAWALERNPWLNASLLEGKVHLWKNVNIGVATAIEKGLIVPVLHDANLKGVQALAAALTDLTARAREGGLGLQDVQHGTFTISNLGMYGIHQFRAVINPPECAILAVGTVVRKPVVINDRDEIAVRPMMTLTLSADHRVVDGAAAARFLQDLVQAIQTPGILLY
jgi:pyruvate dehydrogenase E2 component (dihydrolipoamide acetyltransferase)